MAKTVKYHLGEGNRPLECVAGPGRCLREHFGSLGEAEGRSQELLAAEFGVLPDRHSAGRGRSRGKKAVAQSAQDRLRALGDCQRRMAELGEEARAILATVQPQLDEKADQRREEQVKMAEAVRGVSQEEGLAILSDPESARVFYAAGWSHGVGLEGFSERLSAIVDHPRVLLPLGSWHHHGDDAPLPRFQVSFPRGTSEDEVRETAKHLRPILEAQWSINAGAKLGLSSDTDHSGFTLGKDKDRVMLYQGRYPVDSFPDLETALVGISGQVNYGATEDYAEAHPNWEEDLDIWG